MTPAAKREAVQKVQQKHGLSQRRATELAGCHRNTARYAPRRQDDIAVRERMVCLAHQKPAAGYRMLWSLLRGEEVPVNHKKVYRIYKEEKLALRPKGKKRFKSEGRGVPHRATAPGEEWALDFIHDALCDGRSFRTVTLLDTFTRQALEMECDTSLSGERVVRLLNRQIALRGLPKRLRIDNGPEFRSKALDVWAKQNKVALFFIEPGKPMQNGHIESFNGTFRRECLNQEWFTSLAQARDTIEAWRVDYNSLRPHSSLAYLPPDTWAKQRQTLSF